MKTKKVKKCLYKFGQDRGFCAEIMEIGWYSYICENLEIDFHLQRDPSPKGISCFHGWNDYFKTYFPIVDSNQFAAYLNDNVHSKCTTALLPFRKWILKLIHPNYDYFVFDHKYLRSLYDREKTIENIRVKSDINAHFEKIYVLSDNTRSLVERVISSLNLPSKYSVFHLRRGDKIKEAKYSELTQYEAAYLSHFPFYDMPVYIMSDSIKAIDDIKSIFPQDICISRPLSVSSEKGYDQEIFNKKSPKDRYNETLSIITDLEIARRSQCFFGTNTSNIFWLIRHLHTLGPHKLVDIDQYYT